MYLSAMSINNNVWQHGAIGSCIAVIFSLVAYLIGFEALVSAAYAGANFLIIVLTMVLISRSIRQDVEGEISFFNLFVHLTIGVLCILVARQAFNFVLYNFINPELIEYMIEFNIENSEKIIEMFNVQNLVDAESLRTDSENSIRFGFTLIGSIIGVIGLYVTWIIPIIIVSAIYKRSSPDAIR